MDVLTVLAIVLGFVNFVYTHYESNDACEVSALTDSGWVCGANRPTECGLVYASFRGIPYAEPPTGEYRFAELRAKQPWEGFFNATSEGPICPQYDDLYGHLVYQNRVMSEDCLRVNVHVPYVNENGYEIDTRAKLPILVVIHGGAFQVSSGDCDLHGPEYLICKGHHKGYPFIVITFNYRLNVMGFLSLNSSEIPGNNGLRDQLTLLRWVQTNAAAFGGDPQNVTLAGQSAGAACAHLLSLSPQAKGLFQRVILMSGTAIPSFYSASPIYAKYIANLFLTTLGINSMEPVEIHQQLISTSLTDIMEANRIVQLIAGLVSFVPCVEFPHPGVNMVLDGDPKALVEGGRGKEFTLLVGFTSAESEFFKNKLIRLDILTRIKNNPGLILSPSYLFELPSYLSSRLANKVQERYFNGKPTLEKYMESCSDTFFKYPAFLLSRLREASAAPTYLYYYTYEADYNLIKLGLVLDYQGAAHVEDLTFVFRANAILGDTSFSPETRDDYMKDWMTSIVVNFMACSDPSCTNGRLWPPSMNLTYQQIDVPTVYNTTPLSYDQYKMVEFFDNIDQESRNATAGQCD